MKSKLLHDETGQFETYAEHAVSIINRANTSPIREQLTEEGNGFVVKVASDMHIMCNIISNPDFSSNHRSNFVLQMVRRINMAMDRRGVPVQQEHPLIQEMTRLQGAMFDSYLEKSKLENLKTPREQVMGVLKKSVAVATITAVGVVGKLGWEVHQNTVEEQSKEHVWDSREDCISESFGEAACVESVETASNMVSADLKHIQYDTTAECRAERVICRQLDLENGTTKAFADVVGWVAYEPNIAQDVSPVFATNDVNVGETVSGHRVDISHFKR